jgi:hypothetical protein
MSKKEAPLEFLKQFLPAGSEVLVLDYLHAFKVHLTITRERKTILGDYRHATRSHNHRISVNGNLNRYSFLITLIHELAHLVTFSEYGNRVQSHGKEWKAMYRRMLEGFIKLQIFPEDILGAIKKSLHNLPASSCGDEDLMRVLKKYDRNSSGLLMVEEIKEGALFRIENGKVFKRGKRIRKRFQCEEIGTGKLYLFSPIYEVKVV